MQHLIHFIMIDTYNYLLYRREAHIQAKMTAAELITDLLFFHRKRLIFR
jgi:hypothetical protein